MHFINVLTLASVAMAVPQHRMLPRSALETMTIGAAQDICGSHQTLHCCNDESEKSSTSVSKGLLSGLLNGLLGNGELQIPGQCGRLDIPIIGAADLLNQHCNGKVSCCDRTTSNQYGFLNLGLPCIALGSLLN